MIIIQICNCNRILLFLRESPVRDATGFERLKTETPGEKSVLLEQVCESFNIMLFLRSHYIIRIAKMQ